jgi:hypothetical protein
VLSGEVFVFFDNTTPEIDIGTVEFYVDGKLKTTDTMAPYDLVGGDLGTADPFDTRSLKALKDPTAPHRLEVVMGLIDDTETRRRSFWITLTLHFSQVLLCKSQPQKWMRRPER